MRRSMEPDEFTRRLEQQTGLEDPTAEGLLRLARATGRSCAGIVADALLGS